MNAGSLKWRPLCTKAFVIILGLAASAFALADGSGWYTPEQVAQGRWEYSQKCSVLPRAAAAGRGRPGAQRERSSTPCGTARRSDFYGYVHTNMPLGLGALAPEPGVCRHRRLPSAQERPAGRARTNSLLTHPMDRVLELNAAAAAGGTVADAAAAGEIEDRRALRNARAADDDNRPTQAELDAADTSTDNWLMYNKGYRGERYSTLRRSTPKTPAS